MSINKDELGNQDEDSKLAHNIDLWQPAMGSFSTLPVNYTPPGNVPWTCTNVGTQGRRKLET